ncbi:hypothetical protein BU23DRAFT_57042 [Bimuria novae-zelandiae CBS 107.79]|uniref:Uncharacterized protein n=1 Tax=Bimuria novae-zelandiae CBS 107.79 TaxID=1447943 RepID=A0A6A5VGU8_9PLEO|nr:hypothetical protein BU23DRAFT_57042 [Bimuria novae-zelandiae CBS 107.79]
MSEHVTGRWCARSFCLDIAFRDHRRTLTPPHSTPARTFRLKTSPSPLIVGFALLALTISPTTPHWFECRLSTMCSFLASAATFLEQPIS